MDKSLRILLADDEDIVLRTIGDYLVDSGYHVEKTRDGLAALKALEAEDYDLALFDVQMPGLDGLALLGKAQQVRPETSVVIITGHGTMTMAIEALRLGAADFLTKPIKLVELDAVLEKAVRIRTLRQDRLHLRETIKTIQASSNLREGSRSLVGDSPQTADVRGLIRQALEARCDTILITGETGTGKEVVARVIHHQAGCEESPFIAMSCPAMPDSLVESELFGHVKGAFTGAVSSRAGCFELADNGTLFLDEVGDLSATAQAKLLRVLETRALRRLGGAREVSVNVRVIAATNAPLEECVKTGKFRSDLYFRLNVFPIRLVPIRERTEDILPLAYHFLSLFTTARGMHVKGFSPEAEQRLLSYAFPGNARELRNIIERAAILCMSSRIDVEHLHLFGTAYGPGTTKPATGDDEQERAFILKALEESRWNRRQAAKSLNIPYSTLRYKMQRLGIG